MWVWVFPGFVVAAIFLWIVSRICAYRRFFADGHFLEVSQGVPRLKAAALDRIIATNEDQALSPADPRALVTSAGLAFFYTIHHVENRFVHHYSVSEAGRITAAALGETYALFVAKLWRVLAALNTLARSRQADKTQKGRRQSALSASLAFYEPVHPFDNCSKVSVSM